jgi:phospholipid/cholesterol/gamma-HCH transport system permease protein
VVSANGSPGYINSWFEAAGRKTFLFVKEMGNVVLFLWHTLRWTFSRPFYLRNVVKQMEQIGFNSIPVVLTTALSTGMVLALQSYTGSRFGAETLIGTVVSLHDPNSGGATGLMVAGGQAHRWRLREPCGD